MNMMDAVFSVFSQYAVFNGRARRAEYWYFVLFNAIVGVVLSRLANIMGVIAFIQGIYGLVVIIPRLALSVRRLHDTGRSGWWLLLNFVPLVGSIILLVWACSDSQCGCNKYGPDPKAPVY